MGFELTDTSAWASSHDHQARHNSLRICKLLICNYGQISHCKTERFCKLMLNGCNLWRKMFYWLDPRLSIPHIVFNITYCIEYHGLYWIPRTVFNNSHRIQYHVLYSIHHIVWYLILSEARFKPKVASMPPKVQCFGYLVCFDELRGHLSSVPNFQCWPGPPQF